MSEAGDIIAAARARGDRTLSEYDSKRVLAAYGVPITREILVGSAAAAEKAAKKLGYPVVLKACSADATHKTEKGLVEVNLASKSALGAAFKDIRERAGRGYGGDYLVQEMIGGKREVMVGMLRDPQFGPSVMFGLGGIFTEVLEDVAFRVAPLRKKDALSMMGAIRAHKILGALRGMPAVDRDVLAKTLVAIGKIGLDHPDVEQIDINPMIIAGAKPVAVDALIVLGD